MAKYATEGNISHLSTLIIGWVKGLFSSANPLMDGTAAAGTSYKIAREDHVHPTDTSRAAASHSHGNITNGGDITASAPTIASGDKLIINDESASKITNGPSFGTDTTKYLRNDGTWGTPPGTTTDTNTTYTLGTTGSGTTRKVTLTAGGSGSGTQSVDVPDTNTTYDDFVPATNSAAGANGLVPAPPAGKEKVLASRTPSSSVADAWKTLDTLIDNALDANGSAASGYLKMYGTELSADNSGSLMTSAEKTKLSNIDDNAEVNQNAFSNVKVGDTTIAADGKTDTLELVAGDNVSITPDATNDKVTISVTDNDTYPASTGMNWQYNSSSKTATIVQWKDSNNVTHSSSWAPIGLGTYLSGSASGGKLSIDVIVGSVADGNTGLVTGDAVYDAINNVLATSAALVYQGTIGATGDSPTITSLPATHSKGDVYVVKTAGTYITGKTCEVGDMIICNTDGTAANDAHWDVIQSNIEPLTNTEIETAWQAGLTANGF